MIVVAGLRRSGTSMLMYALKESGLEIAGEKFDESNPEGNPNGYWEVKNVTKHTGLQDELAGDVVKIMFEALPLSRPELIDKTIAIFREPNKVLSSVKKYAPIQNEMYVGKVLLDIVDTLEFLQNKPHLIVFYEDILDDPQGQFKRICGITGGNYKQASATIDPKLNRTNESTYNIENMEIWEDFYNLIKCGKIEEVISRKKEVEKLAMQVLNKYDNKDKT